MLRLSGFSSICTVCVLAVGLLGSPFNGLHKIDAYELPNDILVLPSASSTDASCTVLIERKHFSSRAVDLDPVMSRDEIVAIFDRLAPKRSRGKPNPANGEGGFVTTSDGPSVVTDVGYENVELTMYGKSDRRSTQAYVAAAIKWKTPRCGAL